MSEIAIAVTVRFEGEDEAELALIYGDRGAIVFSLDDGTDLTFDAQELVRAVESARFGAIAMPPEVEAEMKRRELERA